MSPSSSLFERGWRHVRAVPYPVWTGLTVVGLMQLARKRREHTGQEAWSVTAYKSLPLRWMSRQWGRMHERTLPVWSRPVVLGAYAKTFGCNLDEAEQPDLKQYENLGQFFRRRLRDGARRVDRSDRDALVSPCDGRVLTLGQLDTQTGRLEQIKGSTYSLEGFLGATEGASSSERQIYQCVIYLAPGDYHGFHAPADWQIRQRRHFPGHLLSVSPTMVRSVPRLFNLNERVVYLGRWQSGFMAMAAVGATNVGSIHVEMDPTLQTNSGAQACEGPGGDNALNCSEKTFEDAPAMEKGDFFGEFRLGSTIVLVFEAPANLEFLVRPDDKVRMGQPIFRLKSAEKEVSKQG